MYTLKAEGAKYSEYTSLAISWNKKKKVKRKQKYEEFHRAD